MSQKHKFPEWARNQVVYEVNLRQFTPGGTIKEFREHLPRLKELGAGILWFMPVQPVGVKNRKGTLGSYYSISNYHEINPEFGTMQEFIGLVQEIHAMGIYVILDWVANHTAWDHHWVADHPEFYLRNTAGEVHPPFAEWEDVIGLDYSCESLRTEMINEMRFWMDTTGIDGFRCDMAMLVPTGFWNQVREAINTYPSVFMLAEAEQRDLTEEAFDVLYNWNLHHVFNGIVQGKYTADEIRWRIPSEITEFPENCENLLFISNHDENSWNGSEIERLNFALEAFAVLIFTLPGMPLLYTGMEAGNYRRLKFFDKDCIDWKPDKMAALYSKLAQVRMQNQALWSPRPNGRLTLLNTDNDSRIFAFIREQDGNRILVIINLSADQVDFQLKGNGYEGSYLDVINQLMPVRLGSTPCFCLPAWGYYVLQGNQIY